MVYNRKDPITGEIKTQYTLKERYQYYKAKANNPHGKNKQGQTVDFAGRVALANHANSIKRKMGRNKKNFDYYTRQNTIGF